MDPIETTDVLAANGEFVFPEMRTGAEFIIEVVGDFDAGTLTLGYEDLEGNFAAFLDATATAVTTTASRQWTGFRAPISGRVALKLVEVADASAITCQIWQT